MRRLTRFLFTLVFVLMSSAVFAADQIIDEGVVPDSQIQVLQSFTAHNIPIVGIDEVGLLGIQRVQRPEEFQAVLASLDMGNGNYWFGGGIYTYLHVGDTVDVTVTAPDGTVFRTNHGVINNPGTPWQVIMYYGPIPADWGPGLASLKMTVTTGTRAHRVSTWVPIPFGSDPGVQIGPLEGAVVDGAGGVMLQGLFKTRPVAVAPLVLNQVLPIEGWNYIPPTAQLGVGGPTLLVVCSGKDGNPDDLECSQRIVLLPRH
jgi:hypothetical protein